MSDTGSTGGTAGTGSTTDDQQDTSTPRTPGTPGGPVLDPLLLEIVVCPACHADLDLHRTTGTGTDATPVFELACRGCGLVYPVVDGIPVLLVDEARQP